MENKKWGYIRETPKMVEDAKKKMPNSTFTPLEDYLKVIYPKVKWIHDKAFGKHNSKYYRIRPDFRCEEKKIIVEFDGLQHYINPIRIRKDNENQKIYELFGYKVMNTLFYSIDK